ncbi:MAG: minor capsid protein [Paludibacteraceae bacterium]|nr:minor capsid protein [Paludibacteraceae bacterium]
MSYWRDRVTRNEAHATRIAATYSRRIKLLHNQEYRRINAYLDSVLKDVEAGEIVSRSDLWRSKKYIDLRNAIEELENKTATMTIRQTQECLEQVFEQTMGRTMADFGREFSAGTIKELEAQIINSVWSGKDFSSRVWANTHALAERLQTDMAEMILSGKDVHKQLMRDMSVSYRQADRLIRTESAHIYTEASKAAYREANVAEVEWLAEPDACEECAELKGKRWAVDKAPLLPRHCYCRCCLIPIVKIPTNKNT